MSERAFNALTTGLSFLAVALAGVSMYAVGLRDGAAEPVDVRVVYDEDGEAYSIDVVRGDEPLRIEHVTEKWRGNNAAPDGLYDTDPLNKGD